MDTIHITYILVALVHTHCGVQKADASVHFHVIRAGRPRMTPESGAKSIRGPGRPNEKNECALRRLVADHYVESRPESGLPDISSVATGSGGNLLN